MSKPLFGTTLEAPKGPADQPRTLQYYLTTAMIETGNGVMKIKAVNFLLSRINSSPTGGDTVVETPEDQFVAMLRTMQ